MHAQPAVVGGRTLGTVVPAACFALLIVVALSGFGPAAAFAQTPGTTATVVWTAPGDDGSTGIASQYDLRYRTVAISGTDTLSWWNAATAVSGEPTPGSPGTEESMVVSGLDPAQTYYFVLRTADEVPNWSGFSNIAVRPPVSIVDTIPPAAITDLAVAQSAAPAAPPAAQQGGGPPK
jgi:hypothetical protein